MKTKILSILALLLMTVTQGAWADELTVYDGTKSSPFSPVYMNRFDTYTRSQYIIPAAKLEAMNGKIITALKYYSNKSNYTSTCNVDVYLKKVSYTTFDEGTPTFETKSGIVYTGKLSIAGDGTLTITFTTPYTYNGGNLLIGMENTETGNSILSSFYGEIVTGTVAFGSSSTNRGDFIPKTTFTYETPPTAVDLGLPSGTKWADMNVGAGSATGYGTYFAWAATASQADYSQANAPYYSGSAYTKYTGSDYTMLQRGDDAATVNWGSNWRMPTDTELQELIDNTTKEWKTNYNGTGVNGYLVTSKTNGNSIFLPAAGWYNGTELRSASQGGNYWMSTVVTSNVSCGYSLNFYSTGYAPYKDNTDTRYVGFSVRPVQMFAGEGTQDSPYLIASTTDWNNLVSAVNAGETYSGKYFKMTANVGTVSTWMTGTFSGTFDGYGNTLTVGYSATTNNCAPFGYLNGTVQNLKVAGNISTSKQYAGGLAAWVKTGHTANVINCRVAATINSTFSGDGSSAGFVAYVDGRLNVTGCAFTGTLAGSNAYAWGGFVSYTVGRSDITNCLFAPASVTAKADYSATVGRNGGGTLNFANFYYTQKFNTAQGKQARSISAGTDVTSLAISGDATATYNVSGITVYSTGIKYNDVYYAGNGESVSLTLSHGDKAGFAFNQYAVAGGGTLTAQTETSATLSMTDANQTINAQWAPTTISSASDWDKFCEAVNGGFTYSGKTVKLTANVGTVSTWMTGTFSGTFDGDGKTLTVDYDASTEGCAPFGTLSGATIQNLKVAGSISSNQRLVAGIAALCSSTGNNVTNCLVSATINSSYSGNAADGGLVSLVDDGASLNVTGCAFAGKLLGGDSYASGGIVGWRRTGTCTLTNCLYAPASATGSEVWMTSGTIQDGSANFCRYQTSQPAPTITNCYYTTDFSSGIGLYTAQGIQAHSISAGDYVSTLAISGDATATYAVSGITVYSTGISFNDGSTTTFYGGSGQTVSLALTAETRSGYQFKQYAASQGTLSGQTTDAPTLTMPAATGETLYTTYTATAGPSGYAQLVDNDKSTKVCTTFTSGVYIDFNTPNAIVPTGYVLTTAGDASSEYWRNRSPKTWKLYGKLNAEDSWTVLDDVADGNLPNENTTDKSYSIANTAAYKYFRYEISAIKGSTELFQIAELQLKGYDAVVISAEYDPTYNATFADGIDNNGWTIDPTQQIAGGTVTVSYEGENKVKSVTVAPKGALTGKFSVSSTKQVQFSKGNLQYDGSAWSFHTNQYDLANTSNGTATGYPMDSFCWGNIDNPAYDGSTGIGTNGVDLSGSSDWGSNTITNGCTGWRTMSKDEWEYLLTNHSYGYATVAGQTGIIILPDVFTDPMRNNGSAAFAASTTSWTANVYAAGDDWTAMEKAGALFLPAAGGRDGSTIGSVGTKGRYWTSTADGVHAHFISFEVGIAPVTYCSIHGYTKSVRLVKDVE